MYVCVSVSESQQSTVKRNGCDGDDGGACAVNLTMILTFVIRLLKTVSFLQQLVQVCLCCRAAADDCDSRRGT